MLERKVQYQLPKILSFFLVDYSPTATYNTMNVFQERLCAFNPLIWTMSTHLFTPSSNVAAWSNTRFLWLDNASYEAVITITLFQMMPLHMLHHGWILDLHIIPEALCHFPFSSFALVRMCGPTLVHMSVLWFFIVSCALIRERPSISPRDAKSGHPRAEWSLCITWWMNELLIPYNVPVAEDYKYQLGKSVCPGWHIRFSTVTKGKIFITRDAQGTRRVCVRGEHRLMCSLYHGTSHHKDCLKYWALSKKKRKSHKLY